MTMTMGMKVKMKRGREEEDEREREKLEGAGRLEPVGRSHGLELAGRATRR